MIRFLKSKIAIVAAMALLAGSAAPILCAQQPQPREPLAEAIRQITSRPVFRHARFGIEFYSLDTNQPIYQLKAQELFTPASTTKLLTEGAALELLGPDFRFHTRVYRAGPVDPGGTLEGDLVLVASGDPNLSQRIQPNGTLAFENDDHCYGGPPVPGDPLMVIRQIAAQVAAHGIRQIAGRVLVDTSLFPEGRRERGTQTVISPIVVNDNLVDVTASPGASVGAPVNLAISPVTGYVHFVNQATTGPANSEPDLEWGSDVAGADGSRTVALTGTLPLGKPAVRVPYAVPQPSRFAEFALVEALREQGVVVTASSGGPPPDFKQLAAQYTPQNLVAEHTSPPLSEDAKITLKVSQNLHASLVPYLLGAVVGHAAANIDQAGFGLERGFLQRLGLDLSGASQSDGEGGDRADYFTPDFIARYLAAMRREPVYPELLAGLPILGRDGTLADIQKSSPAAGRVFAKTGTFDAEDLLNLNDMVTGKGLAGYMTTADGRHLTFAIYANEVAVSNQPGSIDSIVGEALGEIAAAAYLDPP